VSFGSAITHASSDTGSALSERILAGQNAVLRRLAESQPLAVVLDVLCQALEEVMPGAACSILLLDEAGERLRHATAPSLPADYIAAIDGVRIGPTVGSCGRAAFLRRTIVVDDIETDPLWADWRKLARQHDLRTC
jgi:GAF domain-containing protein